MILLIISFIAGVLTVLAPCVLPLLPVIVGGSIGGGKSIKRAITVTASLAVSVILFTLLIKAGTYFIGVPQSFWTWFSGVIIIFFGIITLFPNIWEKLPYLSKLSSGSNKVLSAGYIKQSFWGDVIVGASLGPVFSTCSPTYFLVLAAVLPTNFGLGILYLLAYSLGLSLALFAIAFVGQKIVAKAGIAASPKGTFKRVLGVLFLIVGIAIITGADKKLQTVILDAGFFDVTKLEQVLLEYVPSQNGEEVAGGSTELPEYHLQTKFLSPEEKERYYKKAIEISTPDGFVNTDGKPITLESLRGQVVLLDIWTYSCINCQRTIPYLNEWYKKYQTEGFEIVGLHTPEFAFEKVLANVEQATKGFGIEFPVVLDNDYSTWTAYGNKYWPRKYLIDIDGYIVYDHIGEGAYAETELSIQRALAERAERMGEEFVADGAVVTVESDLVAEQSKVKSKEAYFGSFRNDQLENGPKRTAIKDTFSIPDEVKTSVVYLGGEWDIVREYAKASAGASIVYKYDAKDVYMVAGSATPVTVDVYKDDVLVKSIVVQEEKLYPLIEGDGYGVSTLRLEVKDAGVQVFSFTFG